jgi:hypothetical protein
MQDILRSQTRRKSGYFDLFSKEGKMYIQGAGRVEMGNLDIRRFVPMNGIERFARNLE